MKTAKLTSALLSLLLVSSLTACTGGGEAVPSANTSGFPVYISEIMSSNESTVTDEDGEYVDYIELYNSGSTRVNLQDCYLSDNENKPQKYKLPAVYIEAHQYLIFYASGKDKSNVSKGIYHTNFNISSAGEVITLVDSSGALTSRVEMPASIPDVAYGMVSEGEGAGQYMWFAEGSPGKNNTGMHAPSIENLTFDTVTLFINEYMTKNTYTLYDEEGDYSDWIELYNPNDSDIPLSGMYLTDRLDDAKKWQFPQNIILPAKGYKVIFLSGKDKITESGEIHASFRLGTEDKTVMLSDEHGKKVDSFEVTILAENVSMGRTANDVSKWQLFPRATPGKANTTQGFDELSAGINSPVFLSEACATQPGTKTDNYEWIKFYNQTNEPVSLQGCGLSTSLSSSKYLFGDVFVPAKGFIVLYAAGETPDKPTKDTVYLPFKLSSSGEELYFFSEDGQVADVFTTGKLRSGVSSGRNLDPLPHRVYYLNHSPFTQTPTESYLGYTKSPELSGNGGYARAGDVLTVYPESGSTVRYTTDGSVPNENSAIYTEPITLVKNVTLRFVAFRQNYLPSDCVTATFILDAPHELPVVCLAGDPQGFFSYETGILADGPGIGNELPYKGANYWKDWEREISFEYFNKNGTKCIDFNAGLKVFGQYSRAEKQKSFAVQVRDQYGQKGVNYPFFENNEVSHFESLVLRSGGQDWKYSKIRDALVSKVIKEGNFNVAYMDQRPVAVYLNGEYYGLYYLCEKINEAYFEAHDGVDPNNVDVIKGNSAVLSGSFDRYKALLEYVKSHDLKNETAYNYICSQIDKESLIDWWIITTYFVNTDSGNIKFYCERSEAGKWRWVIFDCDWALFPSTYDWNYLKKMKANGHGVGNNFSTVLIKGLLNNDNFQDEFIKRYSNYVKNTLKPDRTCSIMNALVQEIRNEMPRQLERWGMPKAESWENQLGTIERILKEKPQLTRKHFRETFGLSEQQVNELFPD